jgi:CheY-like chemotaxis protein
MMADSLDRRAAQILLVEDDEGDVIITREAFEHYQIHNALHVVSDGDQALQFVQRRGEYTQAPRPDLVLLDLNLPGRHGLEVLAELKSDPELRVIPVVVLTTSQAEEDISRSYSLHANAYVSKPVEAANFMNVIWQIDQFFGSTAELPRYAVDRD